MSDSVAEVSSGKPVRKTSLRSREEKMHFKIQLYKTSNCSALENARNEPQLTESGAELSSMPHFNKRAVRCNIEMSARHSVLSATAACDGWSVSERSVRGPAWLRSCASWWRQHAHQNSTQIDHRNYGRREPSAAIGRAHRQAAFK